MIIKHLALKNFGKFQDKKINFTEGINVVYGNNELGKTTVHQFIESFFSMQKNKTPEKIKNFRPWDSPDQFKGDMEININHVDYRLEADYLTYKLSVFENDEPILDLDKFHQYTFLNLMGVQEIGLSNTKDFIGEIQNKIVNLKNVNNLIIHYEEAIKQLENRMDKLRHDAYYLKIEQDLSALKLKEELLTKDIHGLKNSVNYLFELRNKLAKYMDMKSDILDSLVYDEYEQLSRRINKVDALNQELSEIQDSMASNSLFNHNALEEVDQYVTDVKAIENLEVELKDTLGLITTLKEKQGAMGLTQSEKAIKLMAEDMYANDFIMDLENYIQAEEDLVALEESLKATDYKLLQRQAEEAIEFDKSLEDDYMKFISMRSRVNQNDAAFTLGNQIVAIETKLEIQQKKSKPLSVYTGISVLLLMIALFSILLFPAYLLMAGVLGGVFAIFTVVAIVTKFKNNKEIIELSYELEQLNEEKTSAKDTIIGIQSDLNQIYEKYQVQDHLAFEQYYMRHKKELYEKEDPKLKIIDIENKVNELTFNKNMLYRRVRKWILDAELENDISPEDTEHIIPFIENHSKTCVEFMNINNDIFRHEYRVRQNSEKVNELKSIIKANTVYDMLMKFTLDEVLESRRDFVNLETKKVQVSREIEGLLEKMSYEVLTQKIGDKEKEIEQLTLENRISGTREELQDQLSRMNDHISRARSDIHDNMEMINDLSVHKKRLVETKRESKRLELVLDERDQIFNQTQEALKAIEKAANEIKESYTGDLCRAIGKVLAELTGVYDEVYMSNDYEFYIRNKDIGRSISIENLSRGLLDQLYFAVRIGLMDAVNKHDQTPLVLDDTFVHYDDQRLKNVLEVIHNLNRQIIIFTCQSREADILEALDLTYNKIAL